MQIPSLRTQIGALTSGLSERLFPTVNSSFSTVTQAARADQASADGPGIAAPAVLMSECDELDAVMVTAHIGDMVPEPEPQQAPAPRLPREAMLEPEDTSLHIDELKRQQQLFNQLLSDSAASSNEPPDSELVRKLQSVTERLDQLQSPTVEQPTTLSTNEDVPLHIDELKRQQQLFNQLLSDSAASSNEPPDSELVRKLQSVTERLDQLQSPTVEQSAAVPVPGPQVRLSSPPPLLDMPQLEGEAQLGPRGDGEQPGTRPELQLELEAKVDAEGDLLEPEPEVEQKVIEAPKPKFMLSAEV
eukprot:COSAG01_NODE_308_length_19148_cov_13.076697_9_plen_302_part_00